MCALCMHNFRLKLRGLDLGGLTLLKWFRSSRGWYVCGIHVAEDKVSVREFREQGDHPSSFSSAGGRCPHQWLSALERIQNPVNIAVPFQVSVSTWGTYVHNYEYVEHSTSWEVDTRSHYWITSLLARLLASTLDHKSKYATLCLNLPQSCANPRSFTLT